MDFRSASSRRWISASLVAITAISLWHRRLCADSPAPIPVELSNRDGKWQLIRNGQPFAIKGAGGSGSLRLLAKSGGNSLRTWDADNAGPILDEAQRLGLTVTVGLWLGHERQGFDYTSIDQVAAQRERVRRAVLNYRDHPALLLWGLGNEMEGFKAGDNAAVWSEVNNIAAIVKKLDRKHPTMTVVAEIGGRRLEAIQRLCPEVDIVGVNSYGGVASLPRRYRALGGKKPYVVTEFGPPGVWETRKNAWGAAEELTSSEKAKCYRAAYVELSADAGMCLGSYAFLWGHKHEATATWFGMLLPDGSRLAAADTMAELWSEKRPINPCPIIRRLTLGGVAEVAPNTKITAHLDAADPNGAPLKAKWLLIADSADYVGGEDAHTVPSSFPASILRGDLTGAEVRMPSGGGAYRLYAYVFDNSGGAAVANIPLRVIGPEKLLDAPRAKLPFVVLGEGNSPYVPSGWMGEIKAIRLDSQCPEQPRVGTTSTKAEYDRADGWGGVVWQNPANDWGDRPGGYDLTGAVKLAFWARGQSGGEKVKFGFGALSPEKKYHDSAKGEIEATLTKKWKQYSIDLKGKDLHRIKTGFLWLVAGQGKPIVFYLDGVQYQ